MTLLEISGVCMTWYIINEGLDAICIYKQTSPGFLGKCIIKVKFKEDNIFSCVMSRLKNRSIRKKNNTTKI